MLRQRLGPNLHRSALPPYHPDYDPEIDVDMQDRLLDEDDGDESDSARIANGHADDLDTPDSETDEDDLPLGELARRGRVRQGSEGYEVRPVMDWEREALLEEVDDDGPEPTTGWRLDRDEPPDSSDEEDAPWRVP